LRNSGWLEPRFERDGDTLRVWMGPRIETQDLRVNGGLDVLSPSKKRKIRGEPLEPDKLDEVKRWAELNLRRAGHGCPEVAMTAHAWERAIIADVTPGPKSRIADVYRKGIDGLDAEALVRFEAFEPGDIYDVLATRITTSRLLSQGLFQSAYITSKCRGEEIDLTLNADVGRPRLFRFSVGASTEEFPFAEVWYRNTRLDDRASSFTATLHASPIRQSLNVFSEFYILPISKRTFLGPRFEVQRRLEEAYELNQMQLGADLGRAWDLFRTRLQGRAGPTLNYEKTVVGVGPADTKYLAWEGSLTAASHAYEAFSGTQEEGWTGGFDYRGQREGIGSELNVDRYDIKLKHLWNVGGYSPPLFVFASRLEFTAVDIKQDPTPAERSLLPLDYRIFYGGDDNLRGFGREDLNNGGLGYLTVVMAGFELRLIEELPWHLQPFL
jgi:outer membrane translocation and assembly module TamA